MSKHVNTEWEFYIPKTLQVETLYWKQWSFELQEYVVDKDNTEDEAHVFYDQTSVVHNPDMIQNLLICDNEPTTGFKINHNKYSEYSYSSQVTALNITDPRGFDFSISIKNFLHLARHHVIDNGVINAECVFCWSVKGNLTLISVDSDAYKTALEYTKKQHMTFDPDNLVVGRAYQMKKSSDKLIYLGKHKFYNDADTDIFPFNTNVTKTERVVFYNEETEGFFSTIPSKTIAGEMNQDDIDVTELLSKLKNSAHGRTISGYELSDIPDKLETMTFLSTDLSDPSYNILSHVTYDDENDNFRLTNFRIELSSGKLPVFEKRKNNHSHWVPSWNRGVYHTEWDDRFTHEEMKQRLQKQKAQLITYKFEDELSQPTSNWLTDNYY